MWIRRLHQQYYPYVALTFWYAKWLLSWLCCELNVGLRLGGLNFQFIKICLCTLLVGLVWLT